MRKNLLSIAIIAVLVVAMVGGTMAWFTSQAEVENVFEAGTVEIGAEGAYTCEGGLDNWAPGDDGTIEYVFTNNGSLPIKFRVGFEALWLDKWNDATELAIDNVDLLAIDGYAVETEWVWIPTWPFGGYWWPTDIYESVDDTVTPGVGIASVDNTWFNNDSWRFEDGYLYYGGEIGEDASDGIVYPGDIVKLKLDVKLDGPKTGNTYQAHSFKLNANVDAIQAAHEGGVDGWDWDNVDFETGLELD